MKSCKKITFSSFISGDINAQGLIFVENLETWVKCIFTMIYDQFYKTV